jgi:hypothetical protein
MRWQWVASFLLALARKRYHQRKEGTCMPNAHEYATRLAKLPDRIAAIVGKTHTVQGDQAEMADDQALSMIRDLLEELDDQVVERNKKKRIARAKAS